MSAFDHFDRVREVFADQFEEHGSGFLYRKSSKGAPIPVSAAERDRYVARFNRYIKYASWSVLGSIVLLAFYAAATHVDVRGEAMFYGVAAIVAAFLASYYWSWTLPARELRDRGAVGERRTRAEAMRLYLARMTYGEFAIIAGAGVFALLKARAHGDMFSGWNLFWTGLGITALVVTAVQAFRKWQLESRPSKPPV